MWTMGYDEVEMRTEGQLSCVDWGECRLGNKCHVWTRDWVDSECRHAAHVERISRSVA